MIEAWIDSLLHTAFAVSALVGLILLLRRAVARRFGPQAAYALWALPIIRLFIPSLSVPAGWSLGLDRLWATPNPDTEAHVWLGETPQSFGAAPLEAVSNAPSFNGSILFLGVWGFGVIVGLIWLVLRHYHHIADWRTQTYPANFTLNSDIKRAAHLAGLKSAPEVRTAIDDDRLNSGPVVSGLIYPMIVLPERFETTFSSKQRQLALLHEMTHIRRGDLWAAAGMMIFRIINWPNPLIHWAWPRFRTDQEAACDASVLRITGETRRADYAETLLLAATTFGRASSTHQTGLTLSLNHPIKERLMTLGSPITTKRRTAQWALALMLLAGTALTAPISVAADEEPNGKETQTATIKVIRTDQEGDNHKGYEVRDVDGERTYLRVSRDGTTEELTQDEFEAEYDVTIDEVFPNGRRLELRQLTGKSGLSGEPGLRALLSEEGGSSAVRTIIMESTREDDLDIEIDVENGEKRIFRTDEDGVRQEITVEHFSTGEGDGFPFAVGTNNLRLFSTEKGLTEWGDEDGSSRQFAFGFGDKASPAMAQARLRTAQSMLESSETIIANMREDANDNAKRDLRDAEKQLEKAKKALDRARNAVEKSRNR